MSLLSNLIAGNQHDQDVLDIIRTAATEGANAAGFNLIIFQADHSIGAGNQHTIDNFDQACAAAYEAAKDALRAEFGPHCEFEDEQDGVRIVNITDHPLSAPAITKVQERAEKLGRTEVLVMNPVGAGTMGVGDWFNVYGDDEADFLFAISYEGEMSDVERTA